jgi:hypothetical protein
MLKYCSEEQPVAVECVSATSEGDIEVKDPSAKITYVDTSELMRFQMPGTRGGGHADIYRPAIGRLLWGLINGPAE